MLTDVNTCKRVDVDRIVRLGRLSSTKLGLRTLGGRRRSLDAMLSENNVLKLDFSNAFGSLRRDRIQFAVNGHYNRTVQILPSNVLTIGFAAVWITSSSIARRSRQGISMRPELFRIEQSGRVFAVSCVYLITWTTLPSKVLLRCKSESRREFSCLSSKGINSWYFQHWKLNAETSQLLTRFTFQPYNTSTVFACVQSNGATWDCGAIWDKRPRLCARAIFCKRHLIYGQLNWCLWIRIITIKKM